MEEENKGKIKAEIKMFLWYLVTEPFRKIKWVYKTVDDTVTPEFLMYIYIIFTAALFFKNRNDPKWMFLAVIVLIILLRSIWIRKKFIHTYRKEKYKN